MKIAVILLAGGRGTRYGSTTPKQFLDLAGAPVITYSLTMFLSVSEIYQVCVICASEYRDLFKDLPGLLFALPGERRQDSVYNGLTAIDSDTDIVLVHDSARPMIDSEMIRSVLQAADTDGAATVGIPVSSTLKRADNNQQVVETVDRSHLWEIQTPQALQYEILRKGFEYAYEKNITVTDDVSLCELLGLPVHIVMGSRYNVKITTQEDLRILAAIMTT